MNLFFLTLTLQTLISQSTISAKSDRQTPSPSLPKPNNTINMPLKKKMSPLKTNIIPLQQILHNNNDELDQVELKSLNTNNNGITYLSKTQSVISHHQLEHSQMTLRGGGEDENPSSYMDTLSSVESFEKKKSSHYSQYNLIGKFAKWYMHQMETHELRTKCISAGVLGLIGDICAQEVGHYVSSRHDNGGGGDNGGAISSSFIDPSIPQYLPGLLSRLDKRRMLAMFSDGALTTGPLLHYVYAWYERILPIPEIDPTSSYTTAEEKRKAIRNRFSIALIHVLFDNFIMAILYVFLMMVITATLEGKYATIPHEIRHDYYPAICASWKASLMGLAPMQLMSFHYLPVELRVLAVNVQDVIWVTVMSFVTHRNRH